MNVDRMGTVEESQKIFTLESRVMIPFLFLGIKARSKIKELLI